MDQSDTGSAGIFARWTNQAQEARVYPHDEPIRRRKRGYIRTTDQSDTGSTGAGSAGICSRRTNQIVLSTGCLRRCTGCMPPATASMCSR
eukprot:365627-Prorocentrum_minimum.AAC.1